MNAIDLKTLLPDPNKSNYEQIKAEHPYNILLKYAKVIEEKYPSQLSGDILESTDVINSKLFSYGFYILASIGNGYSYRLLDLESTSAEIYPVKITFFENNTQHLPIINSALELENTLQDVLRSGFTHTLILNLLAQIDLYNESRKG